MIFKIHKESDKVVFTETEDDGSNEKSKISASLEAHLLFEVLTGLQVIDKKIEDINKKIEGLLRRPDFPFDTKAVEAARKALRNPGSSEKSKTAKGGAVS